jgi:VHL beta domain
MASEKQPPIRQCLRDEIEVDLVTEELNMSKRWPQKSVWSWFSGFFLLAGLVLGISDPSQAQSAGCDPGGGSDAVNVTFANIGTTAAEVRWLNFQCGETIYTTLAPGREYVQPTFRSHLWRFKEVGTGTLLKEERITTQTRIEFGVPGVAPAAPVAAPTTSSPTKTPPTVAALVQRSGQKVPVGECRPGGGFDASTVEFANIGTTAVEVWWVSFECTEILYSVVQPGASYPQPTWKSHQWRFREVGTNEVLLEAFIGVQTRIEFGRPAPTTTGAANARLVSKKVTTTLKKKAVRKKK